MIHGGIQPEQSTSTSEDVTGSRAGERSSEAAVADDNTAATTAREEKTRVLERVEHEMDIFRKGDCSRFQASSRVAHELGNWVGASDKEKGKAFDSYLAEINSPAAVQDDERSLTRGTSLPAGSTLPAGQPPAQKRIREEVEELLDQVSREGLEEDDNGDLQLGPGSARKRVREEDMPWFNSTYTVQGPGRARANPFFLALDPGPQGRATLSWPLPGVRLAPGQSGRVRVGPGSALTRQPKWLLWLEQSGD
jgi:hypothetical protein